MSCKLHNEYNSDPFDFSFKIKQPISTSVKYWIGMGMTKSLTNNPKKMDTLEDVSDDIISMNSEFFNNLPNIKPLVPIISVDGTCCTGKSTLCENVKSIKTNNYFKSVAMNTNPASAIGYYYTSLKLMSDMVNKCTDGELVFSDRTPWNNFLWSIIWKMLASMSHIPCNEKDDSNSYTYLNNIGECIVYNDFVLNLWKQLLSNIHSCALEELVKSTIPIFIVDSEEENVKNRMRCRAEGSDVERSLWEHYIAVQNYAYTYIAEKFPKLVCIIDINRYEKFTHNDVMNCINNILKNKINLKNMTCNLEFNEDDSNMSPCTRLSIKGKEYERIRPIEMDMYCTSLKRAYVDYREKEYKTLMKKPKI